MNWTSAFHLMTYCPEVKCSWWRYMHEVSITAITGTATLAMHFGWMELYLWSSAWAQVSQDHTKHIRMDRERERENDRKWGGRARRQGRTATNRGLIWEDRGLPHLVISHTCSEMGGDHPWRKTRAQCNIGRKENTQKQKEKSTIV